MPTVFRYGPYRFFFYAGDRGEPRHIHLESDRAVAKFWLDPVRLHSSRDFSRKELREIEAVVLQNQPLLIRAWNDYFGQ